MLNDYLDCVFHSSDTEDRVKSVTDNIQPEEEDLYEDDCDDCIVAPAIEDIDEVLDADGEFEEIGDNEGNEIDWG